ncbi:MAG TPA: DUF4266 domain-containing protein [Opitutaceae bacterium]|nr:DUF4266 domain-containing protein [Opitutaceae bacterium]
MKSSASIPARAIAGGRLRRASSIPVALLLAGLLGALLFTGCASASLERVKPWQRGTLANYTMRSDRDPLDVAMAEHVYYSRETASGGRGVGGSGCGCN